MQRLELDFRRGRASAPWAGRLLLALAVAFAADVAWSYRDIRQAVDGAKQALARAEPRVAPARGVTPAEIATARDTVERIGLPWERLFHAVESAASDDISLAGIEPDAKAGTVLISGEGKDYLAALTYVLNLGREEALERVQLVRHEAKAKDGQGAVTFAISAAWSAARE
jgi:hypothetical protein